mgnify:CR=1 FL=1
MNDYLSIIKKDFIVLAENIIKKNIIDKNFNIDNISIDYNSKSKKGDISTNFLILLRNNLIDKNFDIQDFIYKEIDKFEYIERIEISNSGFVNIFFKNNYLFKKLKEIFINPLNYGNNNNGKGHKINIEFVSANPTGPIHIAHIRGAVLGDVLSSIYEKNGYDVTREYYVNDSGSQIAILGDSLFKRYTELNGKKITINSNEYPGEYLIDIAKKIFDKDGNKWLDENLEKTKKYFCQFAVNEILKNIKLDLKLINIKFDKFTNESDIIVDNYIDKVFNLLKDQKLLYEGVLDKPQGEDQIEWEPRKQLLFKSSKLLDDKDRPFKKSNGEWTYFANDSAYHYNKFIRNYKKLINIWGADHIGYINRMKSIVEIISGKKDYLYIKTCQIVRLIKDDNFIKMSKREGNFVTLKQIHEHIGSDAIRYFMISSKSETPMDLNLNKVLEKNKDNPVFYCQYAYARASSVINKSKEFDKFKNFIDNIDKFNISSLSIYEWNLILKILSWPYLLNQTTHLMQPHKITNYLEDICSDFHSFWNRGKDNQSLRIIDENHYEKTLTKLIWIDSFRIVLKRAFDVIGIDAPENM